MEDGSLKLGHWYNIEVLTKPVVYVGHSELYNGPAFVRPGSYKMVGIFGQPWGLKEYSVDPEFNQITHLDGLTPVSDVEKLISLQMGDRDEEAFGYSEEFFDQFCVLDCV